MIKWSVGAVLLVLSFVAGIYLAGLWYQSKSQLHSSESAWILAEKISKVMKLVAVEGEFNEVYDYKDYYRWDWSPFRKKLMMRIHANVAVGYDLENMTIHVDEDKKTIRISHPGHPRILSVDHHADYYDISQGTFNSFSEEDYNRLQKSAKNFIKVAATQHRPLFNKAISQMDDILSAFESGLETMGWQLQIEEYHPTEQELKGPFEPLANKL